MLKLCDKIQTTPSLYLRYSESLSNAVAWFKSVYEQFSCKLQNEDGTGPSEKYEVEYEILAKEKLLSTIEPLFRIALAKFSYGPSSEFFTEYGFIISSTDISFGNSWLDVNMQFAFLSEILAQVLKQNCTPYTFDLTVLSSDRDQRNKVHKGTAVQCMALLRKYESIRAMLVFLDPDNESLPQFQDDTRFDYDRFISPPCSFSFKETATVLIADSVHDVSEGDRSVIANLPWDLIVDLDGYSGSGGLLSSVAHNSIRKEWLLADKAFPISFMDRLQTMWCRCGEYLLPHYHPQNFISIVGAQCFKDGITKNNFPKSVTHVLEKAFANVIRLQRFVNIVVLSDDNRIARCVISALRELEFEDYYMSWVGVARSTIEEELDDNEGEAFRKEHFYHHACSIHAFFKAFHQYADNWESRSSIKIDYALPTGSGNFVSLSENTRNNLSPYFEILYKDWDSVDHPDSAFADPFQKGGRATWKDIATGEAVPLDGEKETQIIAQIKSNTGRVQQDSPQKNLFFVVHKAGIGGTTFVKQIAWKLHKDMAVLEIKHYNDSKTFQELQNLYDNIIEKNPILLIAEDTLPNLASICDAFLATMKNRRCALLIACRENDGLSLNYPKSIKMPLLQLKPAAIDALKYKFAAISPLSRAEREEREANFDKEIVGDVRTPFLIGLYFLEKDFHIESYVRKVLDTPLPRMQMDMIALLALCDIYGSKYLPSAFVNKALGFNLRSRNSLIQSCPGAESLICRNTVDSIEVYCFKHRLLSTQFFDLYVDRYDSSISRYDLTKKLIEYAAKCQGAPEQEFVIDTLLDILIRNRDRGIDDMTQLLLDIGMSTSQRSLILYLAEQFRPSADRIREEADFGLLKPDDAYAVSILRVVSHAYAHLGRLFAKPPANYMQAAQYFELAENYMPYPDSYIYHMHGNVLYHQLYNKWKNNPDSTDFSSEISHSDDGELVEQAFRLFEKTSELGDVQFGIMGQLKLLFEYLRYIYRTNEIRTSEDMRKLTSKQISYLTKLIDVLGAAKQYDEFDTDAMQNISSMEKQLQTDVLMGDYGKTIEFYQNEYDKLKSSNDTDRALDALQGLVSARIQKAKGSYTAAGTKQKSLYQMISDPRTLFEQIDILLPTLYGKRDYHAYVKRTSLFRHWFQLAKLLNYPVNEAMIKADYWIDLEKDIRGKKNPEPYYYKVALLYLEKLEGGESDGALQAIRDTIARMDSAQQFDSRRGRSDKIRDLLVEGSGMGRLLNVSDCGPAAELAGRISEAKKLPAVLCGKVELVQYWGAELSIYAPPSLMKQKASSRIGRMSKNTLSEGQTNHKVKFLVGFTVNGLRAVEDSVKDQDTGEFFDIAQILSEMGESKGINAEKLQKGEAEQAKSGQKQLSKDQAKPDVAHAVYNNGKSSGVYKIFYPKWVMVSKDAPDEPLYLNGEVDDGIAGVSVRYLIGVFGECAIDAYGGIRNILNTLIHQVGRMDMIIEKAWEDNGQRRYTLRLRDENIELSQLLQIQQTPKISSEVQAVEEEAIHLPNFNGKQVTFIPLDNTLSKKDGKFLVDGIEYSGIVTNIKTNKDRKKAQKYNGKIPAVIQGKPQSGKYSLKMK